MPAKIKSKIKAISRDEAASAVYIDGAVEELDLDPCYFADPDFFQPVPAPTSQVDWLAQYKEDKQSVADFLVQTPWISTRKRKSINMPFNGKGTNIKERYPTGKIYLLPLGKMNDIDFVPSIARYCSIFYGVAVEVLEPVPLSEGPKGDIHWGSLSDKHRAPVLVTRQNLTPAHRQIDVTSALDNLKKVISGHGDALCLIGLTMEDLYDEDDNLFVAGMAAGKDRVAIFSFFRYDPTLSFDHGWWWKIKSKKMKAKDHKRVLLERSCKLLVHEVAHLLGVDHCVYFDCLMNGSGHLEEDFRQPMHLCPVDLRKLQILTGFNVRDRYRQLKAFYLDQSSLIPRHGCGVTLEFSHLLPPRRIQIPRRFGEFFEHLGGVGDGCWVLWVARVNDDYWRVGFDWGFDDGRFLEPCGPNDKDKNERDGEPHTRGILTHLNSTFIFSD